MPCLGYASITHWSSNFSLSWNFNEIILTFLIYSLFSMQVFPWGKSSVNATAATPVNSWSWSYCPISAGLLPYDMNEFLASCHSPVSYINMFIFLDSLTKLNCYSFEMQAALKTIGEEDKYFSKVSLRLGSIFIIFPSIFSSFMLSCYEHRVLICFLPPLGCLLSESQLNLP